MLLYKMQPRKIQQEILDSFSDGNPRIWGTKMLFSLWAFCALGIFCLKCLEFLIKYSVKIPGIFVFFGYKIRQNFMEKNKIISRYFCYRTVYPNNMLKLLVL